MVGNPFAGIASPHMAIASLGKACGQDMLHVFVQAMMVPVPSLFCSSMVLLFQTRWPPCNPTLGNLPIGSR